MTTVIKTAILIDFVFLLSQAKKLGLLIDPMKLVNQLNKMSAFTPQGALKYDAGTVIENEEVIIYSLVREIDLRDEMLNKTKLGKLALELKRAGINIVVLDFQELVADLEINFFENIADHAHFLLSQGVRVLLIGGERLLTKTANTIDSEYLSLLTDAYTAKLFKEFPTYILDKRLPIFKYHERHGPTLVHDRRHVVATTPTLDMACCP
ncbi:hypothetical protein IT409_00160 [Candidatus Falkowbacteria bacterium]|nr:hypothetical protein [Candidatus Falkowbacteria bacterium]